ncbi:MAG: hypothetical protein MK105_08970 [Crocinitomicaceae bacterium]|nr:hypothetical protein [Crocinitomicaceae bacterium]
MRQILFSLFSTLFLSANAQDSIYVQVNLVQDKSEEAIRNADATIMYADTVIRKRTQTKGEFILQLPKGEVIDFSFKHFKYKELTLRKKVNQRDVADTLFFTFEMEYIRIQNLNEIVAAAPGVPVVYYGSPKLHVSDFEIMNNGDVLLLTYPKRLKKGSELLVWNGLQVKGRFTVPNLAEKLERDYRGNSHIICNDAVFGVHVTDSEIALSSIDKDYFLKYLSPILDTNKTKMYFSNFNKDYPAFDYFAYDRMDSTYTKILEIQDDLMMELYRSEYKWVDVRTKLWAKTKEMQTGIDAEVWVGANYFTQSVYYKELYAPMFHRNDTLFVFDYYKDKLRTFDDQGNKLDSISIYHHYDKKHTGWEGNLIQDRVTGQIYAVFDRAGYTFLGLIDTKTGEINKHVKLEYRYAHGMTVHNNFVYYIYRPFESAQKKFLYKERLPYEYGKSKTEIGKTPSIAEK